MHSFAVDTHSVAGVLHVVDMYWYILAADEQSAVDMHWAALADGTSQIGDIVDVQLAAAKHWAAVADMNRLDWLADMNFA